MELIASNEDQTDYSAPSAGTNADDKAVSVRLKILVVEDDYFVALDLEHRLMDAGFEVVGVASTADEAVEFARSEKPDLAIMDIRLAGAKDGIQAAKDLVRKFGIRSIFSTAHADAEMRRLGAEANPVGWLQKPYPPEALITLIKARGGTNST